MKPRLKVSFSGGKTSALMAKLINENLKDKYEIINVFANTGEEDERTLIFANACDIAFGLNLVWVEAVVNPEAGKGTRHRVVNFESASRHGEPFEEVIKKYGIPNVTFQPCNRELKLAPMRSYCNSIGWKTGTYKTAIGIRIDEARRVSESAGDNEIIYPLIDIWPTDKVDVNDFWDDQPFSLGLLEHQGNCKWCWKKSFRKHFRLIDEAPEIYDFPRRMEELYSQAGANRAGEHRVFFRGNTSTKGLFAKALIAAEEGAFAANYDSRQFELDFDGGCSESCEIYEVES